MCQGQMSRGLSRPNGPDIGRWAHVNVKLHFSLTCVRNTNQKRNLSYMKGPIFPNIKVFFFRHVIMMQFLK